MAWYWWVLIVLGIIILIGAIVGHDDYYEEEESSDWANRLAALIIIDDLKYTRPDVWAKCASGIMGRQIDPPSPEQVAKWNEQRAAKNK